MCEHGWLFSAGARKPTKARVATVLVVSPCRAVVLFNFLSKEGCRIRAAACLGELAAFLPEEEFPSLLNQHLLGKSSEGR